MKYLILIIGLFTSIVFSQKSNSKAFKDYWYAGKAEITSYTLEQARYGEIRKGHAVNIFVTEPFSKQYNTKANNYSASENITVLKLNATKKFLTGIYPYSIMTSTFVPVSKPDASLKISSSTQEWCGHEYVEMVNKNQFEISNFSYFQGESFQGKKIDKSVLLEDDIWSFIKLKPENLPLGTKMMLPSFHYLRFVHKPIKAYKAELSLTKIKSGNAIIYTIKYPELGRTLEITFINSFPYQIQCWKDTYKGLTTKATIKKTLQIPYWNKNHNKDLYLREELGL